MDEFVQGRINLQVLTVALREVLDCPSSGEDGFMSLMASSADILLLECDDQLMVTRSGSGWSEWLSVGSDLNDPTLGLNSLTQVIASTINNDRPTRFKTIQKATNGQNRFIEWTGIWLPVENRIYLMGYDITRFVSSERQEMLDTDSMESQKSN